MTVEPIGDDEPDGVGSVVTPVTLGALLWPDDEPRSPEDGTRCRPRTTIMLGLLLLAILLSSVIQLFFMSR